jgi:hypothetical protein
MAYPNTATLSANLPHPPAPAGPLHVPGKSGVAIKRYDYQTVSRQRRRNAHKIGAEGVDHEIGPAQFGQGLGERSKDTQSHHHAKSIGISRRAFSGRLPYLPVDGVCCKPHELLRESFDGGASG